MFLGARSRPGLNDFLMFQNELDLDLDFKINYFFLPSRFSSMFYFLCKTKFIDLDLYLDLDLVKYRSI